MSAWRDHLEANRDKALEDLKELLAIPSISTDAAYKDDVDRAAAWVESYLRELGFEGGLEVVDDGHPIVVMRYTVREDAQAVAYYGHYDVQPSEPDDLWTTPPFEPTIEDGIIRGRGATDDKGQVVANLAAFRSMIETDSLGVNLQVLIEGEEETSGESIATYIQQNRDALQADAVLVSDTALHDDDHPAIVNGLRGICAMEVRVQGPADDLHSGLYGGAIPNPAEGLARALATLKDDKGRVTVPGFYEDVHELSETERDLLAKVPFDDAAFVRETGAAGGHGEEGRSALERVWTRPTLEVNGLAGGYAGKGFKTVLPAAATAKISCRLVPDQDPKGIGTAVLRAIEDALPDSVRFEGRLLGTAPAWTCPPTHPVLRTAARCLEDAFGGETVFVRSGGSIPVVPHLETLGPTVLMGYGRDDEHLHAPNEFFRIANFERGSVACGLFLDQMAAGAARGPET